MSRNERQVFMWGFAIFGALLFFGYVVVPALLGVFHAVEGVVSAIRGVIGGVMGFAF